MRKFFLPCITVGFQLCANLAVAAPTEYVFSGVLMGGGGIAGSPLHDSKVQGTFFYDPDAVPVAGSGALASVYTLDPGYQLTVTVDGHTVSSPEIQKAWVAEGTTNLTVSFGFNVPTIDGVQLASGSFVVGGQSMSWTHGADHLPAVLDLSAFEQWLGALNGFRDSDAETSVSDKFLFNVTSLSPVPEPDTSVLLFLGVVGLALLRRRQSAQSVPVSVAAI